MFDYGDGRCGTKLFYVSDGKADQMVNQVDMGGLGSKNK